jgi:hypothetical protein
MRRRFIVLGLLLLAGCRSVIGPFEHRDPQRVDDPHLSIYEQERRGRDRLALPDPTPAQLPRTYAEFPSPSGR